ncbi:MAG: response regulator [Myxococcota bacterium]|nr:response regulator [Myxococcota bacterium]
MLHRLQTMGVRARLLPGGRSVLASMHGTGRSIETLNGSLALSEIVFSTAGREQIKCLRPAALFVLPLIPIGDCKNAASLEARIRAAWNAHLTQLRNAEAWLRKLGADVNAANNGAMLSVLLAGEDRAVKVQVCEPRKVILPSRGPLGGVTLQRPEDRVIEIDAEVDSAVDLEIQITNRLQELTNMDRRIKEEERRRAMSMSATIVDLSDEPKERPLRILLVGEQLARERSAIDSLRLRNYEVLVAHTLNEAIDYYDRISPELVMADVSLGRSEGIELIPALRSVVGIEEIPVILVDAHRRASRRKAAQQAGAIGYLGYPIDVSKIARHLERTIKQPKRRRFTRYPQQLSVQIDGAHLPSTAVLLGRGGIMVRSGEHFAQGAVKRCDLNIPAMGRHLEFDAEVLYQVPGSGHRGFGLQFQSMTASDEAGLIEYLHHLG